MALPIRDYGSTLLSGRLVGVGSRFARTSATVVFFAWLAYVVSLDKPNLTLDVFTSTVMLYMLFGGLIVAYGGYLALARRLPGPTKLDWAAAGVILVYAAAAATSVYPRLSAEAALLLATGVIAFYAFHDWRLLSNQVLVRALVAASIVPSVFALLSVLDQYLFWLHLVEDVRGSVATSDYIPLSLPRTRGILDSPNGLAMLLGLLLPFALALMLRPQHALDRLLGFIAASLGFVTLFFTQSRGAWLAAMVWLPLFFLIATTSPLPRRIFDALRWRMKGSLHLLALAGVPALIFAGLFALVVFEVKPTWLFRGTTSSHYDSIATAVRIVLDRPLLGGGPYTFGFLYDSHGGKFPQYGVYAHNLYLRVLTDVGVLGLAVMASALALLVSAIYRGIRLAAPERRVTGAACAASLCALLAHGLTEAPSSWNTVLLPFVIVVALAIRLAPQPSWSRSPAIARAPRLLVLLLLPIVIGGWTFLDRSHAVYDQSLRLQQQARYAESAEKAVEAAEKDGGSALYELHAGVSQVLAYQDQESQGTVADGALLDGAIAALQRSLQRDPRSGLAYANLAQTLLLKGDLPEAAEAARAALGNEPGSINVAALSGSVLEAAGQRGEAVQAYARVVSLDPSRSQSPYWSSTPERRALRPEVVAASKPDHCEAARLAATYGAFVEDLPALTAECRFLVAKSPRNAAARADLALALFALGRQDEARQEATTARKAAPKNLRVLLTSAVVLMGDSDIRDLRYELLLSSRLANRDATVLLAYTYMPPGPGSTVVRVGSQAERLPPHILTLLETALPLGIDTLEAASQHDRVSDQYYNVHSLRGIPDEVFVPGDWSALVSPRTVLILDALKAAHETSAARP